MNLPCKEQKRRFSKIRRLSIGSAFLFLGKMGDKAVPFLLTRISDKDRNIQVNTI